jgi:hypothetical protein
MNEKKLKQLFEAARKEAAPVPPADFAADLLRAVHREPAVRPAGSDSVLDQLNRWFPRLALASAAIIIICVAADYGLTSAGLPELGDGAAQISSQFDLNEDGL